MKKDSLIDLFLEFETRESLFNLKYKDFHYWVYIREKIFDQLFYKNQPHMVLDYSRNYEKNKLIILLGVLGDFCVSIFNKLCSTRRIHQADVMVILGERRCKINGDYVETTLGVLANAIRKEGMIIEEVKLKHRGVPTNNDNCYVRERVQILEFFYLQLMMRLSCVFGIHPTLKNEAENIRKKINKEFGIDVNVYDIVLKEYYNHRIIEYNYKRILSKVNPKVIIMQDENTTKTKTVCEISAGRRYTIGMLHGAIGDGKIWLNYPEGTYIPQFPQYYMIQGELYRKFLKVPIQNEFILTTGSSFSEYCLKNAVPRIKIDKKCKTVLFISTGDSSLINIAISLYDQLENMEGNYKLVYRVHPHEMLGKNCLENYRMKTLDRVLIVDTSRPIYDDLIYADCVVGDYSTGLFEALEYTNNIFVWEKRGDALGVKAAIDVAVDLGVMKPFNDYIQLAEMITKIKADSNVNIDNNVFYRHNALNNQISIVRELLHEEKEYNG